MPSASVSTATAAGSEAPKPALQTPNTKHQTPENLQEPVLKKGSAGDSPVPVGDPPTGIAASNIEKEPSPLARFATPHSVRRAAGRHRRIACATKNDFSNTLQVSNSKAPTSREELGFGDWDFFGARILVIGVFILLDVRCSFYSYRRASSGSGERCPGNRLSRPGAQREFATETLTQLIEEIGVAGIA